MYYKDVICVALTTYTIQRNVPIPAGSFRISIRQRNAALASIAWKPENLDSLAKFDIISLEVGDEYCVFRLLT